MAAVEELRMQGPLDLDPLEGEVQEGLRLLLAGKAGGYVGQPPGIAVEVEGVLADVEAELLRREGPGRELMDERVFEDAAEGRRGGLPGPVAPAVHGFTHLRAVTAT